MSILFKVTTLLLVVDNIDFLSATDLGDCGGDLGLLYIRRANSSVFAVINKQDFVKDDLVAFFVLLAFYCRKLFNANSVAL